MDTRCPRYKYYVEALSQRNPSLLSLSVFLNNPRARQHGCRIAALDFRQGSSTPKARQNLNTDDLLYELHCKADNREFGPGMRANPPLQGRIIIIEDLTVNIIEILGTELNIDPLFFAIHLHTVQRTGMRHQMPDEATLPSRLRSSSYINLSYHRPVICENSDRSGGKWVRDTAVNRKVVCLRSTNIALASHSASILKIRQSNGFWIGIVMVDPALGETHFEFGHNGDELHRVHLNLRPFLGPYEDFTEPPNFSDIGAWSHMDEPRRGGTLDDLIHYWTRRVPTNFDPSDPTLHSIAHYPLRIVAAEWVKYVEVMQHCIKLYEYKGNDLPDLSKFNSDLRELQGWRLRSVNSQQKVSSIIRKLRAQSASDESDRLTIAAVIEDYEVISNNIHKTGRRLENMIPVVTSLVQILDARQSFAETANISRLTVLALVFVPLSFVSSLFSMNSETMPGSEQFWQYFAVAIPVTIIVFTIAKPPRLLIRRVMAYFHRRERELEHTEERRDDKSAVRVLSDA